jgi:hypothetical protein
VCLCEDAGSVSVGVDCGAVVFYSICCCFRFGAHYFLGAVWGCLCLVFGLFVLLLLVVACGGVRHFFRLSALVCC